MMDPEDPPVHDAFAREPSVAALRDGTRRFCDPFHWRARRILIASCLVLATALAPLAGAAHGGEAAAPAQSAGGGYWIVGRDGGVFAFGNAPFLGSAAGVSRSAVVDIASTRSGRGYWLVADDGGVFAFGDAPFLGSGPSQPGLLNGPVVAAASNHLFGDAYYLVTATGGVYSFGSAPNFGAPASGPVPHPIVDFAVTPTGRGYWVLDAAGNIYAYGDAPALEVPRVNPRARGADVRVALETWSGQAVHVLSRGGAVLTAASSPNHAFFYGSSTGTGVAMVAIASCHCSGYFLVDAAGTVHAHGDAISRGSARDVVGPLAAPIVAMLSSRPDR